MDGLNIGEYEEELLVKSTDPSFKGISNKRFLLTNAKATCQSKKDDIMPILKPILMAFFIFNEFVLYFMIR